MLKFFRKIRKRLLSSRKIGSYLVYALGEIILVVIGILIALSLNNANEHRQQKKKLENVFAQIIEDIADDTLDVRKALDLHHGRKAMFLKVMNDSLSYEDKMQCKACHILTTYRQVSLESRGYESLKNFQEEFGQDSLIMRITHLYNYSLKYIAGREESLATEIDKTLDHWRDNYDWFPQFIQGQANYECGKYFATSQEYKNLVTSHYIEIYLNHVPVLEDFQIDLKQLASDLQKRLDNS